MVVACFANNPADTYDVILMDVLMPKMNGHQAARAIRAMSKERPDAAKIPIIAQSANAFKEDVQAGFHQAAARTTRSLRRGPGKALA